MKKFSNFISEAGQPEIPNEPTYGRNPSNGYLNDEVVKKLNAVVGRIFSEDQFDPEGKLTLCRSSLSKIGLTFGQYPNMTESNGSFSLPLTLFGGRFGKDIDTPHDEFLNDDGLSHIVEGGLSLHISYEKTDTNQCRLRAHIE